MEAFLSLRQIAGNNRPVNLQDKVIALDQLHAWRADLRSKGQRLVVTNGCFDIIHAGHVMYLEAARNLGEALLVGLNSDASVRALKGSGRPINHEADRALVLAALRSVTRVCLFQEARAAKFISIANPDIYVKGGDYTLDTLDQEERRIVEDSGGRIVIVPLVPGKSTSALLNKVSGGQALPPGG
jgi:D-glycero-beta-D-manno-heptose 1-phosphate adenylyltransferase